MFEQYLVFPLRHLLAVLAVLRESAAFLLRCLLVSTLCDSIYVHGFGRRAGLIDIYVALGNLSVTIPLRVWYPDPDLLVRLADDKLEQIEMWYYTDTTYGKCRPQYQTSGVKVYSRFYTRYKSKDYFLRGADNEILYSDMTPVVSHLMKVTDIDIADVSNSMIHAFSMGRTNFQILGPDGRTLASTLLRVTANAVQLLKLTTTFITDINLKLGHIKQSEILTVTSGFSSHLTNKYLIGLLEIWLHFSDKKVVPLSAFDSSTYNLEIVILSPHILEMVNDTHKGFVMIRGIGEGDGVLNITLISAGCNEVHSKDLAHTQVTIVSKVTEVAMNDDAKYRAEPKSDLNFHQSDASSGGKAKVQPLVEEMSSKSTEKKLSSLETGAIVFVGIIAFIIAGFMTHYFVATLQRHKASVQSTSQNQGKVSSGWVWLDKEILEKHSISTVPDKLIDENDMSASSRNSSKPATLRSSTYMRMHDLLSNEYTECSTPYDLSPEEFDGLRETVA